MKKIAVLTSGGDSPGMNAAIRAVVRSAVFHEIEVCGVFQGYQGLVNGDFKKLHVRSVAKILGRGGTILKSARCDEFRTIEGRKQALENLRKNEIDGLVVIGGNGTFAGAMKFNEEFDFPIVGLPGTIDNDLAGTDNTIGFDTATNTVVEAVDKIRDTADSHNRLFFVEVMGRDNGFIALRAGIATGAIAVISPETGLNSSDLIQVLQAGERNKKSSSIVIVAEGDKSGGAYELAKKIKAQTDLYDIRITVLGHLQRGGSPSCADRVLASRLGVEAVEALKKGVKNSMLGIVNDTIVFTPFDKALENKVHTLNDEVRIARILSI
jgi:6-phosphofructokinase 1|tara:strand:- start:1018 stop:1989 length:972 start_codon:yes stop_codon:yes gene_type:complete